MLPNFFIIGAAKCATTSLASLLEQHPEAAIVRGKEPHFFSYDNVFQQGIALYSSRYSHVKSEKAIGDASTSYSRIRQHPQVINRIKHHCPSAKIIYMVRHPIKRIESAYIEQMMEPHNQHIKNINQAIAERPMMVDSSRYWETFSTYVKAFGKRKVHVIFFEDYVKYQQSTYASVCKFLEIDPSFKPDISLEKKNSKRQALLRKKEDVVVDNHWDRRLLRQVKKHLAPDSKKILAYFNKAPNFWEI